MIPLNRAGTPNEVAQTILFLLSQASTFITGQTIEIAGEIGYNLDIIIMYDFHFGTEEKIEKPTRMAYFCKRML